MTDRYSLKRRKRHYLADHELRSRLFAVRCNSHEEDLIIARAAAAGMPPARWLRETALGRSGAFTPVFGGTFR